MKTYNISSILYIIRQVEWKKKALKQLRKIREQRVKETIVKDVGQLKHFPECSNIKKLKSRDEYRLRVGLWRVIFTESLTILYIEEVKKRDETTY